MQNKYLKLMFSVAISLLGMSALHAQSSINAAGGDATGSGGSMSFSIGQLFYEPTSGSEGTVEPGVQHAYEIETLAVDDVQLDQSLNIYPNPTADYLNIKKGDIKGNLNYQLYDMQGKMVKQGLLRSGDMQINMQTFPVSAYILRIIAVESGKTKTFKVIKK